MRARLRPSLLLSCSLLLLLAAVSSLQAQINGVPASVTSFGFGGNFNPAPGVPASVTSLGPHGFGNGFGDCCFNPFFFNRRQGSGEHRTRDHHQFPIGLSVPVYVPYAVPYPVPEADVDPGDDDSVDVDYTYSQGSPRLYDRAPRYHEIAAARPAPRDTAPHEPAPRAAAPPSAPAEPETVVAPQPNTVLIFKDGHKSEVQNYAIIGGTLFDLSEGRSRKIPLTDLDLPATQKANDERGVDFQVPAKSAHISQKK